MVQSLTCLILKKRNSLSKIWLAAHWDKKLTRYHILQIDIERCINDIIHQEIFLDLRLSGHLLVGLVKIFSRKAIYLLNECTDIISRVRVFRSGLIELSPRKMTAPMKLITLPEIFDFQKADEDDIFHSLQSQVEEITLKETAFDTRLINDDEFFDINGEENIPMEFEENIQIASLLNDQKDKAYQIHQNAESMDVPEYCNGIDAGNGSNDSSDSLIGHKRKHISDSKELISGRLHVSESQELISLQLPNKIQKPKVDELNLEPLSNKCYRQRIKKQKRKLILDDVKSLSTEAIRKQMEFSNLIVPIELAPPSKRLMILKEIGSVDYLLHAPGLKIINTEIINIFKEHLRIIKNNEMVDDSSADEDSNLSISLEIPRGNSFIDEFAPANGFDEQDFLSNELNNHYELLNGDTLPEITMNSDSPINGVDFFNEQRNSLAEEIQLSVELQQDSGCSSNGVSSICQEKIIKLLQKLKLLFKETNEIRFSNLVKFDRKMKVVQKFHSMLMIKKFNIVEIKQTEPYGEIFITKGENFTVSCEDIY